MALNHLNLTVPSVPQTRAFFGTYFGFRHVAGAPRSDTFVVLVDETGFVLSLNNFNEAEFCDPQIDSQAQRALTSRPGDPAAATTRWAAIDRELTDQAPWVPLYNPRDLTLLSARVGNYQYHPYWSLLIDQLWVR